MVKSKNKNSYIPDSKGSAAVESKYKKTSLKDMTPKGRMKTRKPDKIIKDNEDIFGLSPISLKSLVATKEVSPTSSCVSVSELTNKLHSKTKGKKSSATENVTMMSNSRRFFEEVIDKHVLIVE